jgi:hypothetical protein
MIERHQARRAEALTLAVTLAAAADSYRTAEVLLLADVLLAYVEDGRDAALARLRETTE